MELFEHNFVYICKKNKMREEIISAYKDIMLKGVESVNTYTVSKAAGISEKDFYKYFSSIDAVGRAIWAELFHKVQEELSNSEVYKEYGSREKILAYFFTFFDVALPEKAFMLKTYFKPNIIEDYRKKYREFVSHLVEEGIEKQEIKERFTISNYYPEVIWLLHLRLLHFWLHDDSEHHIDTEKAIEVFSKVPLELMGENLFDSLFDSLKFTFERFNLDKFKIF